MRAQQSSSKAQGSSAPESGRSAAGGGANRRQFHRHAVDLRCRITELDDSGHPGCSWECRAVDISRGGMGLRSRRMSYQGRRMFVEVVDGRGRRRAFFGTVRHSRYAQGQGYAIGVEFTSMPRTAAIRNWLAQRGIRS
jgi:hypothetical protein